MPRTKKYCKKCGAELVKFVYDTEYSEYTGKEVKKKGLVCSEAWDGKSNIAPFHGAVLLILTRGHTLEY